MEATNFIPCKDYTHLIIYTLETLILHLVLYYCSFHKNSSFLKNEKPLPLTLRNTHFNILIKNVQGETVNVKVETIIVVMFHVYILKSRK